MATRRTWTNNTGVRVRGISHMHEIMEAARIIADVEVLVGVPGEMTERKDDDKPSEITNAALAYIHDNGQPEVGIPARPFMLPGMKDAEPFVEKGLGQAMRAALRGNVTEAEQKMHAVGLVAQSSIRKKIDEGIPPPLSDYTLKKRAERGRRGAMTELDRRAEGKEPSMVFARPLIDTGEMRKSITYVIRSRKKRKR